MPDKAPEELQDFSIIFEDAFEIMKDEFETTKKEIFEFSEDLHNTDLKELHNDTDFHGRHELLTDHLLYRLPLFFTAIMIGDYYYSIYFPESIRKVVQEYRSVGGEDSRFGKVLNELETEIVKWYNESYGFRLNQNQKMAEIPIGDPVSFPPLLISLLTLYYKGDRKELLNLFKEAYAKAISDMREVRENRGGYLEILAKARADIRNSKDTLDAWFARINDNNNDILAQISTFEEQFNKWFKDRSDENAKALLQGLVGFWKTYRLSTSPNHYICTPLIAEICNMGRFSEPLPLDRT